MIIVVSEDLLVVSRIPTSHMMTHRLQNGLPATMKGV